jgi:hypothetical protein
MKNQKEYVKLLTTFLRIVLELCRKSDGFW